MYYSYGYNYGGLVKVEFSLEDLPDWATHWLTGGSHGVTPAIYGFSSSIGKINPTTISDYEDVLGSVTIARDGDTNRTVITVTTVDGSKVHGNNKYIYIAFGPDYAIRLVWDFGSNAYIAKANREDFLTVYEASPTETVPIMLHNTEGNLEVIRSYLTEDETLDLFRLANDPDGSNLVASYFSPQYDADVTLQGTAVMGVDGYQSDGPNSYVDIVPQVDNRFHSYSVWFKSQVGEFPNGKTYLVAMNGVGKRSMVCIYEDGSISFITGSSDTPAVIIYDDTNLSDGEWQHIICNVNGDLGQLFVNGVLIGEGIDGNGVGFSDFSVCHRDNYEDNHFLGTVTNVAFYERPMSETEAVKLYKATKGLVQ